MISEKLVFIVDDDPLYRELLGAHLKKHDLKVQLYSSGTLCLENLYQQPDLILLDFNLNETGSAFPTGKEIFNHIKFTNPDIKVIMISNQDSGKVVLELIQSGVRDYIEKDSNVFKNLDVLIQHHFYGGHTPEN
jgi:two-component system OmpR family response regulator